MTRLDRASPETQGMADQMRRSSESSFPLTAPAGRPTRPQDLSASVAICAYTTRRWDILRRAVAAASSQLEETDEIILVVDHSPELLTLAQRDLPGVRVLPNAHGRGLSGARNTAVEAARGAVVVFLDDDAVPCEGWLDALLAPYANEEVIGVGGHVAPAWIGAPPAWFPEEFLWVVGCSYSGLPSGLAPIRNPIGANMSFRRQAFLEAGTFSEALGRVGTVPVGCEETELSMRVARSFPERVIVLHTASVVNHQVSEERMTFSYFRRRCWSEGISKAVVTSGTESRNSLSTERRYVLSTLRAGARRDLTAAARGDLASLLRVAASGVGLLLTTAGYLTHSRKLGRRR